MTGLITKAALLSACGMLVAAAAMAGVPSAANSTSPGFFRLVVNKAGVPDTVGGVFTVTVRDLANNPVNGSNVVVDLGSAVVASNFSPLAATAACTAVDMKLANNQLNPNYTLNCANKTVAAFTNAAGQVRFTILGGAVGDGSQPHVGINCARIYADGVLLSSPTASAYDLNNAGGLGAADVGFWLNDLGAYIAGGSVPAAVRGRSDYNGDNALSAADLGILLAGIGRAQTGTPSTSSVAC